MQKTEQNAERIFSPAVEKIKDKLMEECQYAHLTVEKSIGEMLDLIQDHEPHDELRLRRLAARIVHERKEIEWLEARLTHLDQNWNRVVDSLCKGEQRSRHPSFEEDIPF